ncbi:MAG: tetratricopeptide repeat protein [Bryobacterales bacterium]|nr:tetratricopeptide repeat protein [Bryobacterales bacterium]
MTAVLALWLFWNQAEALSQQALELAQQGKTAEAERLWKQALQQDPALFSAAFNLGLFYRSQGRHQDAERALTAAVKSQPKDFNARYLMGATLVQLGRSDDALRHWRVARQLQPANWRLLQVMAVEYAKGRYFRDAAEAAERALTLKTDDPNIYLAAIKARQDAGDHPAALKLAAQMIERFPASPRANFEYAFELHRAGRGAEGLPYLNKAMSADQTYEEPFFFYAEILMQEGRTAEAIAPLRRAIQLRRDYMAAWVALGRALMSLNRLDEAKEELRRAIEINPKHPQPHLLLSQLYFRMGLEDDAAREKELSLKLRREDPLAMEAAQGRVFTSPPQ